MTTIKICGLKDTQAIHAAVAARADMVGFVHFEMSPRHVSLETIAELKQTLPPHVQSVVVTVNPGDMLLADIIANIAPSYIQLHGPEKPSRVETIHTMFPQQKLIKAIAISSGDDIARANAYTPYVDMLLFDAKPPSLPSFCGSQSDSAESKKKWDPAQLLRNSQDDKLAYLPGGNGLAFDWALLKNRTFTLPWLLSGGLDAENVQEAIATSGAGGVDVSSGVESKAGVKDPALIDAFIKAVRG